MTCSKEHRYLPDFNALPDAQGNIKNGRHKCAVCAYVEGMKDALNNKPQATTLSSSIPYSQAGAVRHKDAYQAYIKGYQDGDHINK